MYAYDPNKETKNQLQAQYLAPLQDSAEIEKQIKTFRLWHMQFIVAKKVSLNSEWKRNELDKSRKTCAFLFSNFNTWESFREQDGDKVLLVDTVLFLVNWFPSVYRTFLSILPRGRETQSYLRIDFW